MLSSAEHEINAHQYSGSDKPKLMLSFALINNVYIYEKEFMPIELASDFNHNCFIPKTELFLII